jgi:hypothetical protein
MREKLIRKTTMEISEIKKGTFLTYTPKSTKQTLYLVVKRVVTTKNGIIKVYTDMTHAYDSTGKYHGTDSFRAPYEFSPNEVEQTLKLTDQATIDKINKEFEKNGRNVCRF